VKKSTKRILEYFPSFKDKLNAYETSLLAEEAMKGLNDVEVVLLKLAWFFEAPKSESFNMELLYHHLDDDFLELALEVITKFFREDTFLIKQPTLSFIRKGNDDYFNQKEFASFLAEQGLNYDKRKLNVYYSRGKVPRADVELSGTPYWSRSTVEVFCDQEKNRLKMD
jgi:hypothetical protein